MYIGFPHLVLRNHNMSLLEIATNQTLYNDYVAPGAIEFTMLFVNPNFTKAKRTYELPTGYIFNKDTRNQFPDACRFGCINESLQCYATSSMVPHITPDIDGTLSDTRIAFASAIGKRGGKRDNFAILLNNQDG